MQSPTSATSFPEQKSAISYNELSNYKATLGELKKAHLTSKWPLFEKSVLEVHGYET